MSRFRVFTLLILAAILRPDAGHLEVSYGYPVYSILPDDTDQDKLKETRGYAVASFYLEPAPFLLMGPRVGWSYWNFSWEYVDVLRLEFHKWEFGWTIKPRKLIARKSWLFLEASGGIQHFNITVAKVDSAGTETLWAEDSKTEWGAGRSIGIGLEFYMVAVSVHHDAFVFESLTQEFSGIRFQVGLLF